MKKISSVARLIKKRRQAISYTQDDMGCALGFFDGAHINSWECGRTKIPPKHYRRLCRILHIPHEEMRDLLLEDYIEALDPNLPKDKRKENINKYTEFVEATLDDEIYYY